MKDQHILHIKFNSEKSMFQWYNDCLAQGLFPDESKIYIMDEPVEVGDERQFTYVVGLKDSPPAWYEGQTH